jgi:uncharacterized protein
MTRRTAHRAFPTFAAAFLGGFVAGVVNLFPLPAAAQSFDCRLAHYPDEKTICEHPALSRLDEQLATRYQQEADQLDKDQRAAFEQHEDMFVRARRRCGTNAGCIAQSYENRIGELENMLSASDNEPIGAVPEEDNGGPTEQGAKTKQARSEPHAHGPAKRTTVEAKATETTGSSTTPAQAEAVHRVPERPVTSPPDFAALAPPPMVPEAAEPSSQPKRATRHHSRRSRHQQELAPAATEPPAPAAGPASSNPPPSAPAPAREARRQANSSPSAPAIHWVNPEPAR